MRKISMNFVRIILIAMVAIFGNIAVSVANADPDDFPIIKEPLSIHGIHISGIAAPNQSNVILPTPSQCEAQFGIACYTPPEIRKAYDVPDYLSGAGQTIVLVEAFGSPTILNDIKVFDQQFGLPDPDIQIFYPEGQPVFDNTVPNQLGWAGETTLDVSWAHAIAPGAKIDIVVGKDNMVSTFTNSEQYVFDKHLGNIM